MDNTNIKTLKLNVSTIKSPLSGGGSGLGRVGQEGTSKIGNLATIVKKNRIAINSLLKIQENQEKLPTENINSSLAETNKILVAIQNQLALQSQNEQKEEKENRRRESIAESKRKLKREESILEKTAKGIGKAVGKVALKIVQPIGGIFDKILEFVTLLGAGIATNAAFEWFKDEENKKKLTKFFNILKENWQTLALIAGVLAGAVLIAKIGAIVTGLAGLGNFLLNPATLGAIALLSSAAHGFFAKNMTENIAALLGDGDDEQRKKLIVGLQSLRDMSDEELKKAGIKKEPGGFRDELNKQIYFLKTKKRLLKQRKPIDFRSYQEMADNAEFKEGLNFGGFTEKRDFLGIPGMRNPFTFDDGGDTVLEQRERGGPVTAGQSYLVGEGGPEIFSPNINGSIVNNMRTEKIVQTLSSDMGEGNISMMELAPITNQLPPPEIPVPSGPATEVPEVSSVNLADPYRQLTPMLYGITV